MTFKTEREHNEWTTLFAQNNKLCSMVVALDYFTEVEFGKSVVVTSVYRTQTEHDALYAQTPVAERPASSPHCRWEAVDIRSATFNDAEIKRMILFLNQFTSGFPGKPAAIYHSILGNAPHFHIQRKAV